MRVDKFLKVSRLIKRRAIAKEVSDQGRIEINGKSAKASSHIAVGDEISIRFGQTIIVVKVRVISEQVRKEAADDMYEVLREEKIGTMSS
jgi:ribosomal 50S subunit-recycling heat shock protein